MAILAAILIPSLVNYLNEAKIAKGTANTRSQYTAITLDLATDGDVDKKPTDESADKICDYTTTAENNIDTFSCTYDKIVYTIEPSTGAVTHTP